MKLSRRKLVSATGLALLTAGCLRSASNPKLTLEASVAAQPEEPFTLDVETLQSEITNGTPGKLAVTYKNTGDEAVTLKLLPPKPDPRPSKSEEPGIVLESPKASIDNAEDGFWMPEADYVSSVLGIPQHDLAPSEEATAEYQVWAHPQGNPEYVKLQPGTYRVPTPESATLEIVLSEP